MRVRECVCALRIVLSDKTWRDINTLIMIIIKHYNLSSVLLQLKINPENLTKVGGVKESVIIRYVTLLSAV